MTPIDFIYVVLHNAELKKRETHGNISQVEKQKRFRIWGGILRVSEAGQRMTGSIHYTAEASQREGSRTGARQLQTFYQGG